MTHYSSIAKKKKKKKKKELSCPHCFAFTIQDTLPLILQTPHYMSNVCILYTLLINMINMWKKVQMFAKNAAKKCHMCKGAGQFISMVRKLANTPNPSHFLVPFFALHGNFNQIDLDSSFWPWPLTHNLDNTNSDPQAKVKVDPHTKNKGHSSNSLENVHTAHTVKADGRMNTVGCIISPFWGPSWGLDCENILRYHFQCLRNKWENILHTHNVKSRSLCSTAEQRHVWNKPCLNASNP